MGFRAPLLLAAILYLGENRAAAQAPTAAVSIERSLHARALAYGSPVLAIGPGTEYWPTRVAGGGGLTTGFDIALHPNHDVGA